MTRRLFTVVTKIKLGHKLEKKPFDLAIF